MIEVHPVLLDDFVPDSDQLLISPGVEFLDQDTCRETFYSWPACVPQESWTACAERIQSIGTHKFEFNKLSSIGLFNVAPPLKDQLWHFMQKNARFSAQDIVASAAMAELRDAFKDYLLKRFPVRGVATDFDGIGSNSPKLATVTVDRKRGVNFRH